MKLVAIGDIHGRDIWKQIVAKEHDADEFVFVAEIENGIQKYIELLDQLLLNK
jgi:hypothetical protein